MVLTDDEFVFDVAVFIIAKRFVDGIVVLGLFVDFFDADLVDIEVFSGFVIAIEDMFVDVINGGVLVIVVKLFDNDAEVFVVFHVIVFGVILLIVVANGVPGDTVDGIVLVCVVGGVIFEVFNDGFTFVIAIAKDDVADGVRFVLVIDIVVVCIQVGMTCVGVNDAELVLFIVNCTIVGVFADWLVLVFVAVVCLLSSVSCVAVDGTALITASVGVVFKLVVDGVGGSVLVINVFLSMVASVIEVVADDIDGCVLVIVKLFGVDAGVFVVVDFINAFLLGVVLLTDVANSVVDDIVVEIGNVVVIEDVNDVFSTVVDSVEDDVVVGDGDVRFIFVIAVVV